MKVLGVKAVFHVSSAALVDGVVVRASTQQRYDRRAQGEGLMPFTARELPEPAMASFAHRASAAAPAGGAAA